MEFSEMVPKYKLGDKLYRARMEDDGTIKIDTIEVTGVSLHREKNDSNRISYILCCFGGRYFSDEQKIKNEGYETQKEAFDYFINYRYKDEIKSCELKIKNYSHEIEKKTTLLNAEVLKLENLKKFETEYVEKDPTADRIRNFENSFKIYDYITNGICTVKITQMTGNSHDTFIGKQIDDFEEFDETEWSKLNNNWVIDSNILYEE